MWSRGFRFFWRFALLGLLGNGIAQGDHDGVELGGVVLVGNYIDHAALVPFFLGEKVQDAVLLRQLLELPHILLLQGNDLGGNRVAGQPLGGGLADDLVILALQGQQQRRHISQTGSRQLHGALCRLDSLLDHQIGGLGAYVHSLTSFQIS